MSADQGADKFGLGFPLWYLGFPAHLKKQPNRSGLIESKLGDGGLCVVLYRTKAEAEAYRASIPPLSHYQAVALENPHVFLQFLANIERYGFGAVGIDESPAGVRPFAVAALRSAILRQVGGQG